MAREGLGSRKNKKGIGEIEGKQKNIVGNFWGENWHPQICQKLSLFLHRCFVFHFKYKVVLFISINFVFGCVKCGRFAWSIELVHNKLVSE